MLDDFDAGQGAVEPETDGDEKRLQGESQGTGGIDGQKQIAGELAIDEDRRRERRSGERLDARCTLEQTLREREAQPVGAQLLLVPPRQRLIDAFRRRLIAVGRLRCPRAVGNRGGKNNASAKNATQDCRQSFHGAPGSPRLIRIFSAVLAKDIGAAAIVLRYRAQRK